MRTRVTWIRGERKELRSVDSKGRETVREGKNGGPVVEQQVTKVIEWVKR